MRSVITRNMSLFRVIIFLAIVVLIIISIGGYVASSAGWLSEELSNLYTSHFSFVTGIASVVGLLAFASTKKIRSTDFESEELEKLQSLMKAAQDLESLIRVKLKNSYLSLREEKSSWNYQYKKQGLYCFIKTN
jgi:cell shape-determining protein MreC